MYFSESKQPALKKTGTSVFDSVKTIFGKSESPQRVPIDMMRKRSGTIVEPKNNNKLNTPDPNPKRLSKLNTESIEENKQFVNELARKQTTNT